MCFVYEVINYSERATDPLYPLLVAQNSVFIVIIISFQIPLSIFFINSLLIQFMVNQLFCFFSKILFATCVTTFTPTHYYLFCLFTKMVRLVAYSAEITVVKWPRSTNNPIFHKSPRTSLHRAMQ